MSNYSITRLYATSSEEVPLVNLENNGNNYSVIGILQIDKINLKYPILSDINDYLLSVAPCRFHGPLPNDPGNLCIAGHNYDDDRFFSRLNQLQLGDIIIIYDNSR
ncbi:MAG: sortase [Oscillospiraceae bacterium]|nr:sortase [Oscillospiraceae bacterium]